MGNFFVGAFIGSVITILIMETTYQKSTTWRNVEFVAKCQQHIEWCEVQYPEWAAVLK